MAVPAEEEFYKVVLIGDSGVGKTCLLLRYTEGSFTEISVPNIGAEFKSKVLTVGSRTVKLQVWDTNGQERFRTITSSFYRGSHGILLVYDQSNKESFDDIKSWLSDLERYASDTVIKVLVGNKADLSKEQEVSDSAATAFAESYGMKYVSISAKTGANVDSTFQQLAQGIVDKVHPEEVKKNEKKGTKSAGSKAPAGSTSASGETKKKGGCTLV